MFFARSVVDFTSEPVSLLNSWCPFPCIMDKSVHAKHSNPHHCLRIELIFIIFIKSPIHGCTNGVQVNSLRHNSELANDFSQMFFDYRILLTRVYSAVNFFWGVKRSSGDSETGFKSKFGECLREYIN